MPIVPASPLTPEELLSLASMFPEVFTDEEIVHVISRMKKTILVGLLCGALLAQQQSLKKKKSVVEKITVSYPNRKEIETPQIPVKVTLTKYQLEEDA
jgi:hypothetical protein